MTTDAFRAITENLVDLPCAPIISSGQVWDTIQLALFHQPPHRIPEHVSPYHVVCTNAGKAVSLEQTIDGKTYTGNSVPNDIGIYPAHLWQSFEWHQQAEFLQLYLEPVVLNRINSELYGKDTVELLAKPTPSDPVISQIAVALQNTVTTHATGIAPHQYHIRCRVNNAKRMLLQRELSIAQIAQAVGFSSQSHLNYHFKRTIGLTPTAFLKQ